MKTRATPTDDDTHDRIEIYARTDIDGEPELVFSNPDETHEWINAAQSSTVDSEAYR